MSNSGYIDGLVTMATVTSRGGSYSYARAMCFSRKKWKAQFSEICGIPGEQLEFEKTGESAKDAFRWAFVEEDKRLEEDLFRLMRISLGDEEAVLRPVRPEELLDAGSGYEDGWGPFYILEEVFLILYRKDAVLVMVGNNE